MAYSLSDFITHAQAGDPILLTNPTPNNAVIFKVGAVTIEMARKVVSHILNADGQYVDDIVDTNSLDLGAYVSARDLLNCDTIRKYISEGVLQANAGTISLSKRPRPAPAVTTMYFTGGTSANWGTDANWSTASVGSGDGRVPLITDNIVFDAGSPACTMNVSGIGATLNTSLYASTLDMNGNNLTIEGVCTCTAGTILGKTGTWTINNSLGGSSTINGLTFTKATSTIYVRCATAFDLGARDAYTTSVGLYNLKIADPGITCAMSGIIGDQTHSQLYTFTINGGTISGVAIDLYGSTAAKPFVFVSGSDITSGNVYLGGSQTLDTLNGATMAFTLGTNAGSKTYTMSGNVKCTSILGATTGTFVTAGYNITCTGDITAKFNSTSAGGRNSIITATNFTVNTNTNNGTETWVMNNGASNVNTLLKTPSYTIISAGSTGIVYFQPLTVFGTLTLNPGNVIKIKSLIANKITVGTLVANGVLGNLITFLANAPGSAAVLSIPAGGVAVSYVSFTDINSNTGTITDTNGYNGGGNSGITFA
jgi:hypothetical protein